MNLSTISLADVKRNVKQNDICNFRAMTVALTVSFKMISFYHLCLIAPVVITTWRHSGTGSPRFTWKMVVKTETERFSTG